LVRRVFLAIGICVCLAAYSSAQSISGSQLSHRSSGGGSGNWTLDENGYVGTYFTLDAPSSVTLSVNASGTTNDLVVPHMNLVVADQRIGFDVAGGFGNYQHTFDLPAGTFFVRTEFNNDVPTANRQLTVGNLNIDGATSISNTTSTTINSVNALAAANTYIENYRKAPARVALVGAAPGAQVHVKLKKHEFRFGTAVGGLYVGNGTGQYDVNTYLNNPNYTSFLLDHFNAVTEGNAGKWAYNEGTRDVVTMQAVDRILQFATDHDLDARMHNMLWGDSQQPDWAATLLNNAESGNQAAKNQLREEISERIDYYVGNGDANPNNDRARQYQELDLVNEHSHQPKYWDVYGADGIADIFNETAAAVAAANAETKLYLNEYNVFAWGDAYANWYRRGVDEIVDNGGAIGGIGIQYYPSATENPQAVHSPARMYQTMQNLSVTGLDLSLTEFGVSNASGTTVEDAASILEDTMRLVFGTPNATTFTMWGFWANDVWDQAPLAALMDANWNLTAPGQAYDDLMSEWNTNVTLEVGPDGTIDFSGFYGDYEITIGGQTFDLSLLKGTSAYSLVVAPGDYNGDGAVDASDYTVWRDAVGSTSDLRADGNGDGTIDEADYAIWKSLFGTSYGSGQASIAVPEPAGAVLLVLGGVMLTARRLRSRTN
jgi:GH35 family endo-1,4-beta-xylanase